MISFILVLIIFGLCALIPDITALKMAKITKLISEEDYNDFEKMCK